MVVGFYAQGIPIFYDDDLLLSVKGVIRRAAQKGYKLVFFHGESFNRIMWQQTYDDDDTTLIGQISYRPGQIKTLIDGDIDTFLGYCDFFVVVQPDTPAPQFKKALWLNSTTLVESRPN